MMNEHSKKWINVLTKYLEKPKAEEICPVCQKDVLIIQPITSQNKVTDIHFACNRCKAHEVVSISEAYQEKIFNDIFENIP